MAAWSINVMWHYPNPEYCMWHAGRFNCLTYDLTDSRHGKDAWHVPYILDKYLEINVFHWNEAIPTVICYHPDTNLSSYNRLCRDKIISSLLYHKFYIFVKYRWHIDELMQERRNYIAKRICNNIVEVHGILYGGAWRLHNWFLALRIKINIIPGYDKLSARAILNRQNIIDKHFLCSLHNDHNVLCANKRIRP